MVSVSIITVAPFQWRHNARCTTLEWLERPFMRFKLSTLMRSESQSEKGSGSVRVGGDASFSPALYVKRLVKIEIRQSGVKQIRKDLALCGIAEATVFPDLDGLSRELTWEFGGE